MGKFVRAPVLVVLAVLTSAVLAIASVGPASGAVTALIVPGTGDHLPIAGYMEHAYQRYIAPWNADTLPSDCVGDDCELQGIEYPASFWPVPGWCCDRWNVSVGQGVADLNSKLLNVGVPGPGDEIAIFGYSQGARVVTVEKSLLTDLAYKDQLSITMIGNISRPNGGAWSRLSFLPTLPFLDITFGATPTDTGIDTTDISFVYDGVSDFPEYPYPLAVINALAGLIYVHPLYLQPTGGEDDQRLPWGYTPEEIEALVEAGGPVVGDTTYVTIPAKSLPMLQPFVDLGNATGTSGFVEPVLELVQPSLTVLVDLGYNRDKSPGDPTTFHLFKFVNPIELAGDLVDAVGQGISDVQDGVPYVPVKTVVDDTPALTPAPRASRDVSIDADPDAAELTADAPATGEDDPPADSVRKARNTNRAPALSAISNLAKTVRGALGGAHGSGPDSDAVTGKDTSDSAAGPT